MDCSFLEGAGPWSNVVWCGRVEVPHVLVRILGVFNNVSSV